MSSEPINMITNDKIVEVELPPTKINRKYACKICPSITNNPRIHLRHLRDVHGQKVKIVECPLCIYACQYRQKLNRHLNLIHRRPPLPSTKSSRAQSVTPVLSEPLYLQNNQIPCLPDRTQVATDMYWMYVFLMAMYNSLASQDSIPQNVLPTYMYPPPGDEPIDLSIS